MIICTRSTIPGLTVGRSLVARVEERHIRGAPRKPVFTYEYLLVAADGHEPNIFSVTTIITNTFTHQPSRGTFMTGHNSLLSIIQDRTKTLDYLRVLLPAACLVCERRLRNGILCFRCAPSIPDLAEIRDTRCERCFEVRGRSHQPPHSICPTCITFPLLTDSQRFVWEYRGLPRDFIKAMKYRPSKHLARLAGELLAYSSPSLFEITAWDVVVPIPSSAKTFRKRLFHPCTEIGTVVANKLSIPLVQVLSSNPKRLPQAKLHHDARLRNVKTIFTVTRPKHVQGKRVLVIEDVITTGATVSAAANALTAAGATSVDILALARAQAWPRFRQRVWKALA